MDVLWDTVYSIYMVCIQRVALRRAVKKLTVTTTNAVTFVFVLDDD